MKNLANCKPSEFLRQTVKIKRAAEKWVKDTGLMELRLNAPQLETPPIDADVETRAKIFAENKKKVQARALENFSIFFDAMAEDYAEETLALLALVCFVEPKDVDKHGIDEYLQAVTEMITNEAVINFFTSLGSLGLTVTSDV